jgi:hypothetical protein
LHADGCGGLGRVAILDGELEESHGGALVTVWQGSALLRFSWPWWHCTALTIAGCSVWIMLKVLWTLGYTLGAGFSD